MIREIQQNISCHIVIISADSEKDFCKKIVSESNVIDLRGKLSILETGALIDRANLFISNDSGPVHIAASLGVPVISIFGRKDPGLSPKRWRPLGKYSHYFHREADCPVCLAHDCKIGFKCLSNISPFEVAGKAIEVINEFHDLRR